MPELSGYDVATSIRDHKNSTISNIPMLAFSSSTTKRSSRYQEIGFNGFLPKPIGRSKLLEMLRRLLGHDEKQPKDRQGTDVITQHTLLEEAKQSVRILLVENNLLNQKLARFLLLKAGYQLEVANNGQEAVDKFLADPKAIDLIFMDINMPEMDGRQATELIRKKGYKDVPIIAMTADVMKEDQEKCLASGMNDYVAKPIKREVVYNMVKKWAIER